MAVGQDTLLTSAIPMVLQIVPPQQVDAQNSLVYIPPSITPVGMQQTVCVSGNGNQPVFVVPQESVGSPVWLYVSIPQVVDGVDLSELQQFAGAVRHRRQELGLTQSQVGQALQAYSQSAICRFEKLDVTPRSAKKIRPLLERWMSEVVQGCQEDCAPRKRKKRTIFTSSTLHALHAAFQRNSRPSIRI